MRVGTITKTVLAGALALAWVTSASAQQVRFFPDFSSVANLQLNGAHPATYNSNAVLRLTDGYTGNNLPVPATGSAWFAIQQQVNMGFSTYFKFQIDSAGICCTPADGFAFVIQNAASTDSSYGASGAGVTARGVGKGGMGYAGIPNSFAVEFDTVKDTWDPSSNHVAVQSCGTQTNGPVHIPGTFTIGNNHNVTSCVVGSLATGLNSNIPHLGVTCGTSGPCTDGSTHEVVIEYTPPTGNNVNGTLVVWIDPQFIAGTHQPVPTAVKAINIPYNIDVTKNSQGISLAGGTSAWVGFTASQTTNPQAHDILAWEFTPHAPAQVTQVIPPGGTEADYVFGGHHMGVNYFCNPNITNGCFANDPNNPIQMTVVATPVPRPQVYQRIKGLFPTEQCVVYLQTGGNCIVYTVTCQDNNGPVACPVAPNCTTVGDTLNCITFNTSFYTADPVTAQNADYLKADPIGTNNWVSIFTSYDPNVFDGKTTGTGGSSSDFVATFSALARHN